MSRWILFDASTNRLETRQWGAAEDAKGSLRCLNHFVRAQTPGAHANPFDTPVDECANQLKIRLEPSSADIVRMAHLPPDHRTLATDFTSLCHCRLSFFSRRDDIVGASCGR
jgi:hypothetical protein